MKTTVILALLCAVSLSVFSQGGTIVSRNDADVFRLCSNGFPRLDTSKHRKVFSFRLPEEYAYYPNYPQEVHLKSCGDCNKPKVVEGLKPYASIGAGVSGNLNTYAAEVGLYNHSYWVAIVSEFTPDQGTTQVYMGPKFYKTLCDVTKESQLLAYGALKLHLNHVRDFAFEPGICYVYSFTDKFALQISASTPIYEGQEVGKPTNLSGGLGINWWIR